MRAHADAALTNPLSWVRWTPPQDAWLRMPAPLKLLRGGNQAIGKTWAQVAEVTWRALGVHPHYPTRPPPVEIWVVCTSWSQSVAIQRKAWELAPKDALTSRTRERFRLRDGWGKDNPAMEYQNGSIVRFRTTNQGAEALAGATIDYVAVDEPPDEEVFRELWRRVMRRGGQVGVTLTPINRDCAWLRKLVEAGVVREVHAKLEARNLVPLGSSEPLRLLDGTLMDQAWIDEQRRITPARWAPIILDGEWEVAPEGVFFKCFEAGKHVTAKMRLDATRGPIRHVLGIDYAAADREFGHVAVLCQVQQTFDEKGRPREAIYVLDEVAMSGTAHNTQFAAAVLTMLDRNGLRWSGLYAVHGDNPVTSQWVEKSNLNTMQAVANEMGIAFNALTPRILNAKDGGSSGYAYDTGNQYLYERIASGNMLVHPRCSVLVKGLETWDYSRMHPKKDVVDACRYALKPYIFARARMSGAPVHLYGSRS